MFRVAHPPAAEKMEQWDDGISGTSMFDLVEK
jgi:hypothetical protein